MLKTLLLLICIYPFIVEARSWKDIGPEGASVQRIIADRTNASRFYIVTGPREFPGNLYRTNNEGDSWQRCPLRDVIYVTVHPGSAELFVLTIDEVKYETHLWYSDNHGRTFVARTSPQHQAGAIFLDPNDSSRLYATGLGDAGLAVSNNGGQNWTTFSNLPFKPGRRLPERLSGRKIVGRSFNEVLIPFTFPKEIFASGGVEGASCCDPPIIETLIRSDDRGKSWKVVEAEYDDGYRTAYKFHSDPFYPEEAFTFNQQEIKKLQGNSWRKISGVVLKEMVSLHDSPSSLLGLQNNPLSGALDILFSSDGAHTWRRIDLGLKDLISVLQSAENGLLAGTDGAGVFRRLNGEGWKEKNSGLLEARVTQVEEDPTGTVIYSVLNQHLLYRSTDAGKSWQNLSLPFPFTGNSGYVLSLTVNPNNSNNLIADNGSLAVTKDGGKSWTILGPFDNPAYDPNHSNVVYMSLRKRVYRSTENGTAPQALPPRFPNRNIKIVVDPFNGDTLYFLSGNIFKSTNGGRSINKTDTTTPNPLSMTPLPQQNAFLVLTNDGSVWRTDDGAAHWNLLSQLTLPSYGDNLISAATTEHYFVLTATALFETIDGGKTWTDISGELGRDFKSKRNAILDIGNPASPSFYLGTSRGVFTANNN